MWLVTATKPLPARSSAQAMTARSVIGWLFLRVSQNSFALFADKGAAPSLIGRLERTIRAGPGSAKVLPAS